MSSKNRIGNTARITILSAILNGCGGGGGGSSTADSTTVDGGTTGSPTPSAAAVYGTTSSQGDFATWTISGTNLSAVWQKINVNGSVAVTFTIRASCNAASIVHGERDCKITSATSDSIGVPAPSVGVSLKVLEAGGTALFVYTEPDPQAGLPSQFHIGVTVDPAGCLADVSGEYLYTHTGPGSQTLFGLYRIDANLESITHADFGMDGSSLADANLGYLVASETDNGHEPLTAMGCESGVQRVQLNGDEARILRTRNGALVFDLAAGQGGTIAFHRSRAAALRDFADKQFTLFSFSDDETHSYDIGKLTSGALTDEHDNPTVVLAGASLNAGSMSAIIEPISNATLERKFLTPVAYLENSNIAETIPDVRRVQGIYQLTRNAGDRGIIVTAMKGANGKLVAFGSVYAPGDVECEDETVSETQLFNSGSFVLVER
jgi:hypothetical protein